MLEVSNIAFVRQRKPLFQPLSTSFLPGKITYVVGANGVGKTTLLKILCGILTPDDGQVLFNQVDIKQNLDEYCREFVFIGHNSAINDVLSVSENLDFFAACYANNGTLTDAKAILTKVGLFRHRSKLAYQLSAGQRRKLSLTRLWVSPAKIWILDEPFTSLDKETVAMLESWMVLHVEAGGTIVMTSHQTPSFNAEIMNELALIAETPS